MTVQDQLPVLRFNHAQQFANKEMNFENLLIHSQLHQFEKQVEDSGLSIKVGWKGAEHYIIGGERYTIDENHFLIINKHQRFLCELKSKDIVEGLCIYISPRLFWEAYQAQTSKDPLVPSDPIGIQPFELLEKIYHFEENLLGNYLNKLRHQICHLQEFGYQPDHSIAADLASLLVQTQLQINHQLSSIPSSKEATRRELFKRLSQARNHILDAYTEPIQLDDLAREAALSKFHLLRTFKLVYGITPYQLVLKLRMNKALELIRQSHPIEAIAADLGFSDRRAFTKAFKKAFQQSPSAFRVEPQGSAEH